MGKIKRVKHDKFKLKMARKFIRRTGLRFRRRRFISKRKRFGKLFRKFRFRKAIKPELKFIVTQGAGVNVSAGSRATSNVSATTIATGTNVNEKIGRKCNFVKAAIRYTMHNNSATATGFAPVVQDGLCRLVFWTPRVDQGIAQTYMNTLSTVIDQIDFNTVTVHMDRVMRLAPPYQDDLPSALPTGFGPYSKYGFKSIKFPRKAAFNNGSSTTVNVQKDVVFYTVIAGTLNVSLDFTCKLFYFDS